MRRDLMSHLGKPADLKFRLNTAMEQAVPSSLLTALQGDTQQETLDFEAIVKLYRPKVFRFVLASLRDRDSAETVTQDCFLKAYNARHSFRGECTLNTWLMQIAVNLVRDHVRNRRIRFWRKVQQVAKPLQGVREWISDTRNTPETHIVLQEEVAAIWQAAADLPERQRTVFLLRFVEDMDLLEIASATGLKEGTVKTHLFRALQTVREKVGAQI